MNNVQFSETTLYDKPSHFFLTQYYNMRQIKDTEGQRDKRRISDFKKSVKNG